MRKQQVLQCFTLLLIFGTFLWWLKGQEAEYKEGRAELQEAELVWYSDYSFWNPPEQSGRGSQEIAENTGVEIKYIVPEDNGDIRLSLMMTNRNMPDIITVSDPIMIRHMIESGEVWQIDELMEEYLPDSHLLKDYPQDVKDRMIQRDGGWYGLLSNLHSDENRKKYGQPDAFWEEMQRQKSDYGIIWNKALLKRMGLSLNRLGTEEEVLAAFQMVLDKEMTVNGNDIIPLQVDGSRYQKTTLEVLFGFFGAGGTGIESGREESLTEEGYHTLQFLNEMVASGYVSSDQFVMTPYQVQRILNSGQVLCFIGDIVNSGIDPQKWVSNGVILSSDGSKPILNLQCRESRDMTTFVSKSCEHPEAAAKWLDYITSDEGMEACLSDCEWWPLRNDDWYYCVKKDPDEKEKAWQQLLCAFARTPETVICRERTNFLIVDEHMRELDTAVSSYKAEGINTLIMEENTAVFDRKFDIFREQMERAGVRELEKWKRDFIKNLS